MAAHPDQYSVVLATVGLANLEREAIGLSRTLDADGGHAQASLVRQAFIQLLRELEAIAVKTAAKAERYITDEEQASRVRPDTQGTGGRRLSDELGKSHPLPGVEGSVGINFEPALVPWWWTSEEGYSGHVGRQVRGYFFDVGFASPSRPSQAESRVHPLFAPGSEQSGPRGGRGTRMTIQRPIPARRFVREGASKAERDWHADIARAKARFIAQCVRANQAAPRRTGRPRRP